MPDTFVPNFNVLVNGQALPKLAAQDILSVAVHEDVDTPGMFTLRMINWDMYGLKMTWSDDAIFALGSEVEVQLGYEGSLKKLMLGEIVGLEPDFNVDEVPALTVRGYDVRQRLLRGTKTRSFVQVKDSDIASQIISAANLSAQVVDSKVKLDYVLQHNQTDLDFLHERARRIGYEVAIDDKTVLFRPFQNATGAVLTLDRVGGALLQFYPRMTSPTIVSEVTVQGWDPKQKKAIASKASAGSESGLMGNISGTSAVKSAFGVSSATTVDQPVSSKAEADAIAKGRLNTIALDYIEGEGVCIGDASLRAGSVIAITGLGTRFSGNYYVVSTIHSYQPQRGYRTTFTVRRNAT
ncbi:MAG: phage late control D family protein [Oscillochloris sp.]|nr:phage late control D family protein [Oscillochloris sp.]